MNQHSLVSSSSIYPARRVMAVGGWRRFARLGQSRTALQAAGLLSFFVALLAVVQFATPSLAGNDGYYHIKMAYLMRTRGLVPSFDWLPLTVLNAGEFVDHHFLYHVLLIPFTFGDLRLGAKLASVLFPSLTFLAVWWLLRGQKVPYAALWSAGLLVVSEAFIYRMSMPRAQSLSLGALVLALHWLLNGHYRRLLSLAFLYVWLYDAFPLILLVAGAYVLARWLVDRRLEWRALAYASLGLVLGLLVNPYFPDNLLFIYRHVGPKLIDPTGVPVGSEWYPYKTTQLMENSGLALAAFLAGVLALGLHSGRMGTGTATSLLVSILFGAMLFKSRRFVEYFPAFGLIFGAISWAPMLREWLEKGFARPQRWITRRIKRNRVLAGLMVIVLLPALYSNLAASRHSLERAQPYLRYAEAAAWLQANTPAGARVFQTDWDDFTRLFYYNTHNTYTLGLDPTYTQLYSPGLYELWVDISKGRVERPSAPIGQRFGANYVMTDLKHKEFLRQAGDDPGLVEVYRDDDAVVLRRVEAEVNNE